MLNRTSLIIAATLMLGACMGDAGTTTLNLGFSGLPELGPDYVYEGWIIVDGAPVTAGRFTVDADSNPSPASFELDSVMVADATTYVLTIEPTENDDPGPSSVHILAGDFSGDTAGLTIGHGAALATDFSTAAGEYILETPSSAAVAEDYNQGIWWLVPGAAGMEPGLTLPALPEGWVYEGWVVGSDGPVSTGTFSGGDAADSDMGGPEAGTDGTPPFPGQDFVNPATVLTNGHMAVISVEPVPDNSPMPFVLKPLADTSIEDLMAPTTQAMDNIISSNAPSGSITR